ncbi:MAG: transaldolase family protein [bacterium]|nr:transaldolase family protein [bacterium]
MKKITFNRSIFLDSSSVKEVEKWNSTGVIDGVTTNQSIMLKDGLTLKELKPTIKSICRIMKGRPVSIELTDSTASAEEMLAEARKYREIAENVVVKVPMIPGDVKSLVVIKKLCELKIPVNVTAMMTFEQLFMAALAVKDNPFPSFISLFWARSIEDHQKYRSNEAFVKSHDKLGPESKVNADPARIVSEIEEFLKVGGYANPKLIVGSIRNASQVGEAFAAGGNIVTVVPAILESLLYSERTLETNADFDKSWVDLKKRS